MKVLIDGREVEVQNDVKIIWDQMDEHEKEQELHLTCTYEGIIADRYKEGEFDETTSVEHDDIINLLL